MSIKALPFCGHPAQFRQFGPHGYWCSNCGDELPDTPSSPNSESNNAAGQARGNPDTAMAPATPAPAAPSEKDWKELPPDAQKAVEEFCRYGRSYEWLYGQWLRTATGRSAVLLEVADRLQEEYLTDKTGEEADDAYNQAVRDCINAVNALAAPDKTAKHDKGQG